MPAARHHHARAAGDNKARDAHSPAGASAALYSAIARDRAASFDRGFRGIACACVTDVALAAVMVSMRAGALAAARDAAPAVTAGVAPRSPGNGPT